MTEGGERPGKQKQRHGCLTTWLVLMLVMNSFAALVYFVAGGFLLEGLPGAPSWTMPALGLLSILNLVCAVGLWRWKKWGFAGFCFTSAIAFVINLSIGTGIGPSLMGLLGLAILFGVLQIGKENKGWPQLE